MIRPLTILFLLTISLSAYSQKVKYKDLIVLLNARQYNQAEPFLKRYLKDNNDNPNAFLFMGLIYQEKANQMDMLVKTNETLLQIDSAIIFFDKAYKEIDEKELRRNSEYYESYSRRDLRTGKFGVKLSDVQLDLENKLKGLKDRKGKILLLKEYFTKAEKGYSKCQENYSALLSNYGNEREFYLRSNEEMVGSLKGLVLAFDSTVEAFNNYKSTDQLLGKTGGHNQILDLRPIKDIKRDGSGKADFLADDLHLWDYKSWATKTLEIIENDIVPIRKHLVSYDIEIDKLREKLKTDSVSVRFDLAQLSNSLQKDRIRKYDPDPMPFEVFAMKITELNYASDLITNKKRKDSSNVSFRLSLINGELSEINRLDSITTRLGNRKWEGEAIDYASFIKDSYGSLDVLKNLISSTKEYAQSEKLAKEKLWEKNMQSLKWEVDGQDSIPLFKEEGKDYQYNLKPLVVVNESYTIGLKYPDSLAVGYLYTITPSRIPDVKVSFPVDKSHFKKRNLPLIKGLSSADSKGQLFFALIYSEEKVEGKFPCSLAKIYRTDGLAWSNNMLLEMPPTELLLSSESGELSIKTASGSDSKMVILDKNGKPIQ